MSLNLIDKILIRLGIVTNHYKKYAHQMQKALDKEHMNPLEYYSKYHNVGKCYE